MPRHGSVVPLLGWRPAADNVHAPKGLPLLDLFDTVDRFVWSRPGVAKKSRANRMRTKELARALPTHPTPADVGAWMCSLDAIMAPGTVDQHRRSLSAVYRYGADLGVSQGNPAALVPARRYKPDPRPIVNIRELWPTLMEACADDRERAFLGVMRFAGLRRGEALGLMRGDVVELPAGWSLNVIRQRPYPNDLHHTKPKSESGCRELPVREPLRELLAPVLALPDPQVWAGHGGRVVERVPYLFPYREHELGQLAGRLREVAPLAFPAGHKMWHALRDTLAVEMRTAGKAMSEVSEMLGHSSEYVTRCSYTGVHGRSVARASVAGLDPPTSGPKKRTPVVAATGVQRRSKAGSPTIKKENQRCDTPSRSVKSKPAQPKLPGMQVAAVVTKPKRATAPTRSSAPSASQASAAGRRKAPPPVEWSEVVTFGPGVKPCPF